HGGTRIGHSSKTLYSRRLGQVGLSDQRGLVASARPTLLASPEPSPSIMVFTPEVAPADSPPSFVDLSGDIWVPMNRHVCSFGPKIFFKKMMNLIRNPNINSSWLFRADIIYDDQETAQVGHGDDDTRPRVREIRDIARQRILVRTLIPRNARRDDPLHQTCTFHESADAGGSVKSLVIYIPHA